MTTELTATHSTRTGLNQNRTRHAPLLQREHESATNSETKLGFSRLTIFQGRKGCRTETYIKVVTDGQQTTTTPEQRPTQSADEHTNGGNDGAENADELLRSRTQLEDLVMAMVTAILDTTPDDQDRQNAKQDILQATNEQRLTPDLMRERCATALQESTAAAKQEATDADRAVNRSQLELFQNATTIGNRLIDCYQRKIADADKLLGVQPGDQGFGGNSYNKTILQVFSAGTSSAVASDRDDDGMSRNPTTLKVMNRNKTINDDDSQETDYSVDVLYSTINKGESRLTQLYQQLNTLKEFSFDRLLPELVPLTDDLATTLAELRTLRRSIEAYPTQNRSLLRAIRSLVDSDSS